MQQEQRTQQALARSQTLERSIAIQRRNLLQAFEAALKELGVGGHLREQMIDAMKKYLGKSNARRASRFRIEPLPLALSVAAGMLIGVYAPNLTQCESRVNVCQVLRLGDRTVDH